MNKITGFERVGMSLKGLLLAALPALLLLPRVSAYAEDRAGPTVPQASDPESGSTRR